MPARIFRLTPDASHTGGKLELIAQSTSPNTLDMPDNITVAPWGGLFMAEDGRGPTYIRGLGPGGAVFDFARNAMSDSEFTGVCFSPDGKAMFVNIQNGSLTFAITGPFVETFTPPPVFADVPAGHWARPWIEALYAAGVTGGCGANPLLYCPEAPVTREQMAVFLLRSKEGAAYTPPACATAPFRDVPCDSPFAPWIRELVKRGVTAGCGGGGNYCPGAPVTRQEVAVFLLKALEGPAYAPPPCTAPPFADVPCSSPFAPWIATLVQRGITAGCSGTNYCPTGPVTRAQIAVFLVRTFTLPF